jgi:predicted transcriptional regulator of viral defense system
MKNKFISRQSNRLLSHFHALDQPCFDMAAAYKAMPGSKPAAVRELLRDMTSRGLLMRLKEGLYYIIPYEDDPDVFMPDWHLIAGCLAGGSEYYVGFYSALHLHNLITQPSLKEQIVVSRQIRPSEIRIRDVPFQFICLNRQHFFGSTGIWVDNFNKVSCSDLEKTIIDCLFKPDYAGGIVEVSRAIHAAEDRLHFGKMLEYAIRFGSQAVIKRLGFLLETLGIQTGITGELRRLKTDSYIPLDTELPRKGRRLRRWGILQNLDTDTITSAIYT